MLTVFCRARNLDVQDFNIAAAVELKHIIQTVLALVFHIQIDLRHIFEHAVLDTREHKLGEHDEHGRENAALVEAAAKGEADDGRGPETSRRGQTLDALPLGNDDGARTDEADTRNNLCTEARHICKIVHIQIQILTRQRGDGRADADEDVRAEAGRAALVRALDTDNAAADERAGQTHEHGKRRHVAQAVKNR